MVKTTYKDYIGITRSIKESTELGGILVSVKFINQYKTILQKILSFIRVYISYTVVYFWCPFKCNLSTNSYGTIGKRSRGNYSNLWLELSNANVDVLKYLVKEARQCFDLQSWIRNQKFQKVTNKKLKEHLDMYLPKLTQV
jgi:hypothetical protein